jgi:hypothetical protein
MKAGQGHAHGLVRVAPVVLQNSHRHMCDCADVVCRVCGILRRLHDRGPGRCAHYSTPPHASGCAAAGVGKQWPVVPECHPHLISIHRTQRGLWNPLCDGLTVAEISWAHVWLTRRSRMELRSDSCNR